MHTTRFHSLKCAAIACALASLASLNGATMILNPEGESDYANPDVWDIFAAGEATPAGRIPTVGDTAVINAGKSAVLSTDLSTDVINILNISNQVPGESTTGAITLNAGAVLNTGRIIISQNGSAGSVTINGGSLSSGIGQVLPLLIGTEDGVFNLSGGTYNDMTVGPHSVITGASGTVRGIVNISGGSFNVIGGAETDAQRLLAAQINISGGTVNLTGGQVVPGAGAVFTVEGNAATILTDRLNLNANAASFIFKFDADGISPFVSSSWMNLGQASITVDGTGYRGGSATFPLFTSTNLSVPPAVGSISLTGWEGYEVAVVTDENNGTPVGLSVVVTGEPPADTWAGYSRDPEGYVDTGAFLGLIWVGDNQDFIWSNKLGKWIYLPEEHVSTVGAWTYFPDY